LDLLGVPSFVAHSLKPAIEGEKAMVRKAFFVTSISLLMAGALFAQGSSGTSSAAASTSDATKKPAVFRPTKEQIKQVQTILIGKKLYKGEATGVYNDATRAAIKSFQKDNGLTETGTLNRATLEKFAVELTDSQKQIPVNPSSIASSETTKSEKNEASATSTKSTESKTSGDTTKKPTVFRATADQIRAAQKLLRDGKMLTGGEDGKLDDPTRDGLKKYQEANGVKVTGTLNAATLEKMAIPLTDKQKADAAATASAAKPGN
jgi:peptidoglycan hydrolase-like protein with peptidoglycan-binding domain